MKPMKRLCLLLAISLVLFGTVFLPSFRPAPVYGASVMTFRDVAPGYWGYPFIDFAATTGIINGYPTPEGGRIFLPEAPVTREESMQMIYMAVTNSKAVEAVPTDLPEKYKEILEANQIAEWARLCTAFGLEYGILELSELEDFRTESGVSLHATREQVARWTGRAIARELLPASVLTYQDRDQIAPENIPYIDLLYRMEIMVGDNLGRFNPKAKIKRVEFATICTRVYDMQGRARDSSRERGSYQGIVTGTDSAAGTIGLTGIDGTPLLIHLHGTPAFIVDGIPSLSGYGNLPAVIVVLSWGPFAEIHLQTGVLRGTGVVEQVEQIAEGYRILSLSLSSGTSIHYIIDEKTLILSMPRRGDRIEYIADGVRLIEIAKL